MKFPFQVTLWDRQVKAAIANALREDLGRGDKTTDGIVGSRARAHARLVLKEDGVVAGLPIFESVFGVYDPGVRVAVRSNDGCEYRTGCTLAEISGSARSILTCERVALNYIQHMSGIATLTNRFVKLVKGTGVRIVDTRKTTPGLRHLEKYGVLAGGGYNHRPTLSDLVLIKDNHIKIAGGIREAVAAIGRPGKRLPVEVEIGPRDDLASFADLAVDIVMLDNWPLRRLRRAIRVVRGFKAKPLVEVSGRIRLDNVRKVAECGPDFISVGLITHSAPALDMSLDFETRGHDS